MHSWICLRFCRPNFSSNRLLIRGSCTYLAFLFHRHRLLRGYGQEDKGVFPNIPALDPNDTLLFSLDHRAGEYAIAKTDPGEFFQPIKPEVNTREMILSQLPAFGRAV
jgi:hypothetical protein